eukprot:CAMPEP_0178994402 /NCGR_PEP_ID=MMETSP0795-20121207/7250_1 /TAXON_ID=88552 /ORGANISM="Amoebophrya sp., Strain Ameob2" /LENGTH=400 /DNA_ID=CAMNT_0020686591 /DNA_START=327 /DNA_END=1526 /DNA_ORIENTATION=+
MESEDLVASNPYRAPSRASIGAADPYNDTAPYNAPTAKARQSYAKLGRPVSDKNILDAKKAAPPPPAPGSTAVDFPAVTAMGLGLITLLWFLSMTTNKLSDEDYKKLGPGVLGQYGGGVPGTHFYAVQPSVRTSVRGVEQCCFPNLRHAVHLRRLVDGVRVRGEGVRFAAADLLRGHDLTERGDRFDEQNRQVPELWTAKFIGADDDLAAVATLLRNQKHFVPEESGKKVDDGKISPEAAQMGVTHDTLKAMGCPHEEACHEDVRKRKEKIDQYRLRYREENLSERDRLLQTCPYPALWLFFLIAGIPLLAIGSLFLLQDGMIRNYNAIIVISSCLVGAILGLVIMMIPWVKQKNFRHEPLRKMELALENPDDDDFEMFDVDVGGDGGDAEESADIGGDW